MGLDSYMKIVEIKDVIDDFSFKRNETTIEFKYWRKHQHLHNFMRRLFIKKGGDISISQFNCQHIRVTIEDLDFLANDMDWHEVSDSTMDYYSVLDDVQFIKDSKYFLLNNPDKAMYFYSWY